MAGLAPVCGLQAQEKVRAWQGPGVACEAVVMALAPVGTAAGGHVSPRALVFLRCLLLDIVIFPLL